MSARGNKVLRSAKSQRDYHLALEQEFGARGFVLQVRKFMGKWQLTIKVKK